MNCFHALLYTLAIAIWMQVRITNGTASTTASVVSVQASSAAGSLNTASVVTVQASSVAGSVNTASRASVQASSAAGSVNTASVPSVQASSVAGSVNTASLVSVQSSSAADSVNTASRASVQASSAAGSVNTASRASVQASSVAGSVNTASVASIQASSVAGIVNTASRASVQASSAAGSVNTASLVSVQSSSAAGSIRSANSTASVNRSTSPRATPVIGSSAYSNKTFQPSQQVSTILDSFPSMEFSYSSAILATSFVLQPTFTLSAPGQTSKTSSWLASSDVIMQSPNASQSTRVDSSMLVHSSSKGMPSATMMTQNLVGSLTVAVSNSSSTSSPPINATSASPDTTPSTSIAEPRPTLPPQGTKFVNMEVSFELEFKEEYSDPSSQVYQELVKNLTTTLEEVYKNVEGFVSISIILIKKGSVVCSYVVILAEDADVEKSKLKEILEEASEKGKLPFKVKSIKVTEDESKKTEEMLPGWAKATMIVLGCLCAVFLIIVIFVCVRYRRSLYGDSDAYFVSSGELGLGHTYDTVGDNKMRANQGYGKTAPEKRVIGSHSNPAYGANGAFAD